MTRTFSDRHPKVLPACNFLSQYYFYNIFLQKSCRFSLQTLTKFEAAKTGSGVGFLRLTAVWTSPAWRRQPEMWHFFRDVTAHVQHVVTWRCPEVENVRTWRFATKTRVLHVSVLILLACYCAIFVPNQGKVTLWLPLCLKPCSGSIPGHVFSQLKNCFHMSHMSSKLHAN